MGPGGAYEAMVAARDEGKVRFIGVTGHDWVEVAKAVATGLFDTVLCWYNCALREAELTVFVEAAKHNTGVVIMNASRNDRLFDYVRPPASHQPLRHCAGCCSVRLAHKLAQP